MVLFGSLKVLVSIKLDGRRMESFMDMQSRYSQMELCTKAYFRITHQLEMDNLFHSKKKILMQEALIRMITFIIASDII